MQSQRVGWHGSGSLPGTPGANEKELRQPTTAAIAFIPIAFWLASLLLAIFHREPFRRLASEDGPIETTQTAVLLGCALLGGAIALALRRSKLPGWCVMYCGLAAVCLWTAGEEISWGQRVFELETPEWLSENRQGEANLHNLPGVGATLHRLVAYGLWPAIVLSLVTAYWQPSQRARWRTALWVPPPILIPAWLCFLSYDWVRALDQWWFARDHVALTLSRLQEPAELILYGGVLAFLAIVLVRVQSGPERAGRDLHDAVGGEQR